MNKVDINREFIFNDNLLSALNIPKKRMINNQPEIWKYVRLDRHSQYNKEMKYLVSSYGRVYDISNKKILHASPKSKNALGENYMEVSLKFNGERIRYMLHRLVALSFLPIDESRPFVNHKDGHPTHNYLFNLEWVNQSENTLHAVRMGLKIDKRGENRSNALWTDDEIRLICSLMEEGHKATYIYHVLGDILKDPKVEYERVRTLYKHIIRKTHWTHISKDYDIDFSRFNYAKEQMSIRNRELRILENNK